MTIDTRWTDVDKMLQPSPLNRQELRERVVQDVAQAPAEGVQRLPAQLLASGVGAVPAPDLGVKVPAQVVEGLGQGGHLGRREVAQVDEAHHNVGELHSRVVDVVLDLHRVAEGAQGAHQGVAEDGVAQVADVRRLVGVDVGVLDDHFLLIFAGVGDQGLFQEPRGQAAPVEVEIEVSGPLDPYLAHQVHPREGVPQGLGDRPRVLLQAPGQVEGGGKGQISQLPAGRRLGHRLVLDAVGLADPVT